MQKVQKLSGAFASVERASLEKLEAAARVVASHRLLSSVLNVAGVSAMVLNRQRQVLFANEELLRLIGAESLRTVVGCLPGEALGCVNAKGAGCGSSPQCDGCGAAGTILACQDSGEATAGDCLLTVARAQGQEPLEFSVKAAPLTLDGESLTVVSLRDVSAERRREALERVFFHDILNTITGLYGHVQLLQDDPTGADSEEILDRIARICDRLRREVQDQRSLGEAESGTLQPELLPVQPGALLEIVRQFFAGHVAVSGKTLEVSCARVEEIVTDSALLVRVLINMVKNAFEATVSGDSIRLSCSVTPDKSVFSVWNPGFIPEEVAGQIFRRSFSTKGRRGRGLGTYSMKLFGERYLGGQVSFISSLTEGTAFSIALPRQGG